LSQPNPPVQRANENGAKVLRISEGSSDSSGYIDSVTITYALEPHLIPAEFIDVLVRSTLAERRPVHRPDVMKAMLEHADIIVTARIEGLLVGVSRAISDFTFCTYLSDLAVDEAHQRGGIGRELIRRTHEAGGLNTPLVLIAAPKAVNFYRHIGKEPRDAFMTRRRED
jgi:GNAT superfamily N-acetyltransferase